MRSTRSPSWIDRLLGLDPLPAPPHAFSLDEDGLTLASFHRQESGHWRSEGPVRQEAPGQILEPGHLGGTLRRESALGPLLAGCLEQASSPIRAASLVLPDPWLRLVFTESPDLPGSPRARDEIVRFKLKRLVPYRVEDLRLGNVEVAPLPRQEEPRRLLVGFANDTLLAAIEAVFRLAGIHVGRITNRSLALVAALEPVLPWDQLGALVVADSSGFSLTLAHRGEPVLHRRKEGAEPGPLIEQELRLTRTFLEDRFAGHDVARCLLVANPGAQTAWQELLTATLGVEAEELTTSMLPWTGPAVLDARAEAAALFGVVRVEVE